MNPVRFLVETDKSISSVCFFPGGHGGVATPVPIPNTEVKGSSGEGTAGIARGRVARCQDFFSGEDVVGYPPLFLFETDPRQRLSGWNPNPEATFELFPRTDMTELLANTDILGIFVGLIAAFFQSCSYLASARYVRESNRPAYTLLPPAFLFMGLLVLPILPFVWPDQAPSWRPLLCSAFGCIWFCILANGAMFFLLKHVDSSRSSPLLAFKVPMFAIFYTFVLGQACTPLQWCGVALVMASMALLCGAGRRIPPIAWLWLFLACAGYCASDYCIRMTFAEAKPVCSGVLHYSFFSCAIIYTIGGLLSLVFMPLLARHFTVRMWKRYAAPYAFAWLFGMFVLFLCFALCDLVLGNIVQSTRGLISVVLGWFIARSGRTDLEERVPIRVTLCRIAAAILLIFAMGLYTIGGFDVVE